MPERRSSFDAIVVGAGMAGVAAAGNLAEKGMNVAVVEKLSKTPEKSLFINADNIPSKKLLEWLSSKNSLIPCPDFLLVNAEQPERNLQISQSDGTTFAVFHEPIIDYLKQKYTGGVEEINARAVSSREMREGVEVTLSGGQKISSDFLVDATGNYSQLSRNHTVEGKSEALLDDDPLVLWIEGIRAYGKFIPDTLIDPIGKDIGLSWVLPYSSEYGDIIAADYSRLSQLNPHHQKRTLRNLIDFCSKKGLCEVTSSEIALRGFIRAEPVPSSAASGTNRMYITGEAAGMGSPLMLEVVPAAMQWGERLADFIADGKTPLEYFNEWRRRNQMFPYDLEMAMLRRRLKHQAKGNYGSNAPIYQAIINGLPPDVQRQVLTTRRIPVRYWPQLLGDSVRNISLLPSLAELGIELAKVKMNL